MRGKREGGEGREEGDDRTNPKPAATGLVCDMTLPYFMQHWLICALLVCVDSTAVVIPPTAAF